MPLTSRPDRAEPNCAHELSFTPRVAPEPTLWIGHMNSQTSLKESLHRMLEMFRTNDPTGRQTRFLFCSNRSQVAEARQVAGNSRSSRIFYLYLSKTILGAGEITGELHEAALYDAGPAHFLSVPRHRMLSFILMWRVSIIRGPIKARGDERGPGGLVKKPCPSVKC